MHAALIAVLRGREITLQKNKTGIYRKGIQM